MNRRGTRETSISLAILLTLALGVTGAIRAQEAGPNGASDDPGEGSRSADCQVQCSVSYPGPVTFTKVSTSVGFSGSQTHQGCTWQIYTLWDFGDGQTSATPRTNHSYTAPGPYEWKWRAYEAAPGTAECAITGMVYAVPATCAVTCSAVDVVSIDNASRTVQVRATAAMDATCGPYNLFYLWRWGDGTADEITATPTASHTYAAEGEYTIASFAVLGKDQAGNWGGQCPSTTVRLGCPAALEVGFLAYCADSIAPWPPQGDATYLLQGHISINDTVFCTADATFAGNPSGGKGIFSTTGNLFLKRPGDKPLLNGPDLSFDVDGAPSLMTLRYLALNPYYALAPDGILLENPAGTLDFGDDDTLYLPVKFYIGRGGDHPLARLKGRLKVPRSASMAFDYIEVDLDQPAIKVLAANPIYNEAADDLTGTADLAFPELGAAWTVQADLKVDNGCINRLEVPTFPLQAPLDLFEKDSWQFHDTLQIKLADVCDSMRFQTLFDQTVIASSLLERQVFSVEQVVLAYVPPEDFKVRQGNLHLACETITELSPGSISKGTSWRSFQGRMRAAWWDGRWEVMTQGLISSGKSLGSFILGPDFCTGDPACDSGLAEAKKMGAAPLPFGLPQSRLTLRVRSPKGRAIPTFIQDFHAEMNLPNGALDAKMEVTIAEGKCGVTKPTISTWLPQATRYSRTGSPEPSASVSVPAGLLKASFSAHGTSALPSATLLTPSGQTITPDNAASFPGVSYFGDPDTRVALYSVLSPDAGTWTVSSDLVPPEVTYLSSFVAPDPSVALTSVVRSGESVSISGSVSPASEATLVDVVYSSSPGGLPEGTITAELPGTAGTISALWDTTALKTGTYFVGLQVSQSGGFPVEAWSSIPVVVSHGGPAPPTNLTGTRAGDSVSLTWTASGGPDVTSYTVQYTGDPSLPGYRLWEPAGSSTEAMITGLDPSKNYRFAVVATDAQGARSAESNAYTTQTCAVSSSPSAPGSVQVGQAAPFQARATREHCTGAITYDWNFADGSHSSEENPVHTFTTAGQYPWTLTVASDGVSSTFGGFTYVTETPVCSLTCSALVPASGKMGQPVTFSGSVENVACVTAAGTAWNFGDGTMSGDGSPSHVYGARGTYPWVFTVTADGFSCTESGWIQIEVGIPGDCDGSDTISIGEVQKAINMFLGIIPPDCGVDCNGDGTVSIGEVQKVINGFLGLATGC